MLPDKTTKLMIPYKNNIISLIPISLKDIQNIYACPITVIIYMLP